MITFAETSHIASAKRLWQQAFGDTEEAANYYFSHLHQNANMLIDTENGSLAAMLTMLPLELHHNGRVCNARYIFAVATDEKYRSRGISTRLIEYAHDYMANNGADFSVLTPASETLFDFYAKRGYERAFFVNKRSVSVCCAREIAQKCKLSPCNAGEYYDIRMTSCKNGTAFAAWNIDMLAKIMEYVRFCGGEFYKLEMTDGFAAAYVHANADEIAIKELVTCNVSPDEAIAALCTNLNAKKYSVILPPNGNNDTPFAMIRRLRDDTIGLDGAYFNLAMD